MVNFSRPRAPLDSKREHVLSVLSAALDAVDPIQAVRRSLRREGNLLHVAGRTYDLREYRHVLVVGGGKAGAPMAAAVETILGDSITAGHVNVKYGYTTPTRRITVHEAGHPVPDEAGVEGTRMMLDLLRDVSPEDLVLCLISGGGSALMTQPVEGVSLEDMQALTGLLLRSGAPIQAMNAVRKHLSGVNGGQLARLAYPATVITLILSDVVGSPLDVIASGPTVPDPTTFSDALAVLDQYDIIHEVPESIRHYLSVGAVETPKTGDPVFARVHNVIVADNAAAARAAAARAEVLGFHTLMLSTYVEGEAREVAKVLSALAKQIAATNQPLAAPACLLLGGETTVTVRGTGRGGRNQELALAAALAVQGLDRVMIASLATDGSDGPTNAAGGVVDGTTVQRGQALGLDARTALVTNDAYPYLEAVDDLLVTGPTNTNVNDLMAVFVFDA